MRGHDTADLMLAKNDQKEHHAVRIHHAAARTTTECKFK
jgi:hypothetical protein